MIFIIAKIQPTTFLSNTFYKNIEKNHGAIRLYAIMKAIENHAYRQKSRVFRFEVLFIGSHQ